MMIKKRFSFGLSVGRIAAGLLLLIAFSFGQRAYCEGQVEPELVEGVGGTGFDGMDKSETEEVVTPISDIVVVEDNAIEVKTDGPFNGAIGLGAGR